MIPQFYRTEHAFQWSYAPDQQRVFESAITWREQHATRPAGWDRRRVHLLLIDVQKDFCFPQGALFVAGRSGRGALEDNDRTARFIYDNLDRLTEISCTMDTHFPHQIFFPSFWLQPDGKPPAPHREVSTAELRAGALRPNPALATWLAAGDVEWLTRQTQYYCAELEKAGKYKLYLWPPHCLLGSEGHTLAGVVHEARLFHAYARAARAWVEIKGANPLTEFYSALAPEVPSRHDGGLLEEPNTSFLRTLLEFDAVIIAGQASSHCVKSTIDDLLSRIEPELARKVYILRDCMSAVTVPDPQRPDQFLFDFTTQAEVALDRFREAGMHAVDSTTPMHEWPGMS
ncbi:MAG: nicotinamidase [Longimicrobiales bacterium]